MEKLAIGRLVLRHILVRLQQISYIHRVQKYKYKNLYLFLDIAELEVRVKEFIKEVEDCNLHNQKYVSFNIDY